MHQNSPKLEPYAIVVADMVGYSQRLATHPADTHAAFKAHLDRVFTPTVHHHNGRVIKTTGDGIVAIFVDAGQAERCAREIQLQMENHSKPKIATFPIKYRVAGHYGMVMVERNDVFGLDVNIAIHLQHLAPPGGVCLSGALFSRLAEQGRQGYQFLGRRYLKNIPTPIAVYAHGPALSTPARPQPGQLAPPRRRYLTPPPRLGLLEFKTAAASTSQGVVTSMAYDALSHGLSHFEDVLVVVPIRVEASHIESNGADFRTYLSREMGCEYLLHGSCIVGPDSMSMTAHLESLTTKELVWSGRLNLDLQNRIEHIDRVIASEIVAPIVLYLGRAEAESWGTSRHSEDEIRFREATALMAQRTLEALGQARLILSEIIRRCGEIGNVYVALARAEHSHGLLLAGEPFIESLERAWEYAKKAISIDDLNSRAHAELALQEMFLKRQDSAAEIYRHAMKLNPYDPMLRADWADCLVNLGRAQEAVPILQDVLSGWPKDRAWVEWNLCDAYWTLGEPERIVALLKRQPDLPHVHRLFAASYAKLGNLKEAKHHVEKVGQHQPGFSTKEWGRLVPVATSDAAEEYVDHLERAGL